MMRYLLMALLALSWSGSSMAGIETELVLKRFGACTVRVSHDATPDATSGTLVLRLFEKKDGIHQRCPSLEKKHVSQSLGQALKQYKKRDDLKPITSVNLGRLVNYPWIKTFLESKAGAAPVKKLSDAQFNAFVSNSAFAVPFRQALESQGFTVTGASCEKHMFYRNGAPQDGMCWLVLGQRNHKTDT